MFYILCHVLYIYVNFNTCFITFHLCCTKIPIFVVLYSLLFMLYQHKLMLHQHNNLMLYQELSAVPLFPSPHTVRSYPSPEVACGPTYPTGSEITRHIVAHQHVGPCGAVIECLHKP